MEKIFRKHLIRLGLEVDDWKDAISQLAGLLFKGGYVKMSFLQAVIDREIDCPTGLPTGKVGVAIPHTDSRHVLSTAIAIGILSEPVKFHEMGNPESLLDVNIIMMLAIKEKEEIIPFLKRAVMIFQDQKFLQRLIRSDSIHEVLNLLNDKFQEKLKLGEGKNKAL